MPLVPSAKLVILTFAATVILAAFGVKRLIAELRTRSLRARALASAWTFERGPLDVSNRWPGTALTASRMKAWNLAEGVHRARRCAAFDAGFPNWHGGSHMWSVVLVEAVLPPGAPTAGHRRGFAPWRIEFGSNAILALTDGKVSPDESAAVRDELNDVLDVILGGAPPTTV